MVMWLGGRLVIGSVGICKLSPEWDIRLGGSAERMWNPQVDLLDILVNSLQTACGTTTVLGVLVPACTPN